MAACTRGNITYEATIANLNVLDSTYYNRLLDAFLAQDVPAALLIYKEVRDKGFDSQFFINGLGLYLRDLMAAANPATISLVELPGDMRAQMAERGAKLHPTFIYKAMELCNSADFNFRAASNKQFLIELTLIRLCQLLSPSPEDKETTRADPAAESGFSCGNHEFHHIRANCRSVQRYISGNRQPNAHGNAGNETSGSQTANGKATRGNIFQRSLFHQRRTGGSPRAQARATETRRHRARRHRATRQTRFQQRRTGHGLAPVRGIARHRSPAGKRYG